MSERTVTVDGREIVYHLVRFDEDGRELAEDGKSVSDELMKLVGDGVTDVFFASHGWKGDVPVAIASYDSWVTVMAQQSADRAQAVERDPAYKPLIVCVHWPSLPWGDENAPSPTLADEGTMSADELVNRYASRVAATPDARTALHTIVASADQATVDEMNNDTLPPHLDAAYQTLFAESGLGAGGMVAAPGTDQKVFAPLRAAQGWHEEAIKPTADRGIFDRIRDAVLGPVRQLSFWTMKHRARVVGESGVHVLLRKLQQGAHENTRFHLMGHSFGCIVVTAAITGPLSDGVASDKLPRPVNTLFLVQGAMSLWSFADEIPEEPDLHGYFRPVVDDSRLVTGALVTTRSTHDMAVGTFYPLGARLTGDPTLGVDEYPEYGGTGSYGAQGTESTDRGILQVDGQYGFALGATCNIDASAVINTGGFPSGAHSDIAKDRVAHIFWQAALTSMEPGPQG